MRRFVALDSWRGLCALLVACYHFQAPHSLYWNPLIRNGWLFVDFFFVLSGFVIGGAYGDRLRTGNEIGRFVVLRLGRVWPLHVAMLLLFVLMEATLTGLFAQFGVKGREPFSGAFSIHSIFTNLLLIHSWGIERLQTWNGPSWSISTEFFAYLAYAAIAFYARGRQRRVLVVLAMLLPIPVLAGRLMGLSDAIDVGTLRCLQGFVVGVLTQSLWFEHHARIEARLSPGQLTAIETAGLLGTLGFVCMPQNAVSMTFAPYLFGLTVLAFSSDRGGVSRFLQHRALVWLGMLSYSIYMVHIFIQGRLNNVARLLEKVTGATLFTASGGESGGLEIGATTWQANGWFVLMLVLVVIASWITFKIIEEPFRDRSRGLADRWFGKATKAVPLPPHS